MINLIELEELQNKWYSTKKFEYLMRLKSELKEDIRIINYAMENFTEDDKETIELNDKVQGIVKSKNLNWKQKYKIIFSEEISKKIFTIAEINYYDPDTSYEVDVKAFAEALNDWVNSNVKS